MGGIKYPNLIEQANNQLKRAFQLPKAQVYKECLTLEC